MGRRARRDGRSQRLALSLRTGRADRGGRRRRLARSNDRAQLRVGWSQEEFAALGIRFERRGARTDEYLAAMRTLWREDPASFTGEFVNFADIRVNPNPPATVASPSSSAATATPPDAIGPSSKSPWGSMRASATTARRAR
jgi:Luciferase-like monooxygenase